MADEGCVYRRCKRTDWQLAGVKYHPSSSDDRCQQSKRLQGTNIVVWLSSHVKHSAAGICLDIYVASSNGLLEIGTLKDTSEEWVSFPRSWDEAMEKRRVQRRTRQPWEMP